MTGRASTSRVRRWFDESRILDRLFLWLLEVDNRRGERSAHYERERREAARDA